MNDVRINTTRLKQKLLAYFPDLQEQSKGRNVMLVFERNVGAALDKACEQDSDGEAVCLAHAAQIVC